MSVFASLVERLADLLQPLFATTATAAAIVLFTLVVRLAIHPLSRASARGQKARTRIAPQLAELRKKHAKNPERLKKAVLELHAKEKVSPFAGILPSLLQAPAFFLMYHLFSGDRMAGHALFAAPLGDHWADALSRGGVFGPAGQVPTSPSSRSSPPSRPSATAVRSGSSPPSPSTWGSPRRARARSPR